MSDLPAAPESEPAPAPATESPAAEAPTSFAPTLDEDLSLIHI